MGHVKMDAGWANAEDRFAVINTLQILNNLTRNGIEITKNSDGSCTVPALARVFDRHLFEVYTETCTKHGGSEWLYEGEWVQSSCSDTKLWKYGEVLLTAVANYMQRAGIKKHTEDVVFETMP